jgi:SLOG family YspA-like protein
VCGGRDYENPIVVSDTLNEIHADTPIALVIHGAAPGADLFAEQWAKRREINYLGVPAKWSTHGNSAGPIRNREMLRFKPGLVVAFPGYKGTADMVSVARAAHIAVKEIGK